MPISYTVDAERRVVFERWSGSVTAKDISDYWHTLTHDRHALSIRRSLADLRGMEIRFSEVDFFFLIRTVALPGLGNFKWTAAIVADRNAVRALRRQVQIYMQTFSRSMKFSDRDAALEWVLEQQ